MYNLNDNNSHLGKTMTLNQLKTGESGFITGIHADKQLKQRLQAFGLTKGLEITVDRFSMAKKTMEMTFKHNRLALRASEADCIEITPLKA